jgi:hypothetical protein
MVTCAGVGVAVGIGVGVGVAVGIGVGVGVGAIVGVGVGVADITGSIKPLRGPLEPLWHLKHQPAPTGENGAVMSVQLGSLVVARPWHPMHWSFEAL